MRESKKVKCKVPGCYYTGFPPMLRLHLYMAHGIDMGERYEKEK